MLHVLRFDASTPLPEVVGALSRVPGQHVALVFPLGAHCELGRMHVMCALNDSAVTQGRDITFIGGDEALRACAVATGFAAATSIEEWHALDVPLSKYDDMPEVWTSPELVLVSPEEPANGRDDDPEHLFSPWHNDPPAYVAELMEDRGYDVPDDTPISLLHPVTARSAKSDQDELEAVRAACERYEEGITEQIRRTSGVQLDVNWPALAGGAQAALQRSNFGDSGVW